MYYSVRKVCNSRVSEDYISIREIYNTKEAAILQTCNYRNSRLAIQP